MGTIKWCVEIDQKPNCCKSCNFFDCHRCVVGDYAIGEDETESFPDWCPLERVEWHPEKECIPIKFIKRVRDDWNDYGKGTYPYSADVLNRLIELWEKQNESNISN